MEEKHDLLIRGLKKEWIEILKKECEDDDTSLNRKLRKIIKDYVEEKQTNDRWTVYGDSS